MVGEQQDSFLREFLDQLQRVLVGNLRVHLEFRNDFARHNLAKRRGAVGGAPNRTRGER